MSTSTPKKSKLYTRTGDQGTSALYDGSRCNKTGTIFDAIGTIDELNSFVGVAYTATACDALQVPLNNIQQRLLDIGACLATPKTSSKNKLARVAFEARHVTEIERIIDILDSQVPKLGNFILPGGTPLAAALHVCRSVSRRAERCVLRLTDVDSSVLQYMNRLSDFFFAAARYANHTAGVEDVVYMRGTFVKSTPQTTARAKGPAVLSGLTAAPRANPA